MGNYNSAPLISAHDSSFVINDQLMWKTPLPDHETTTPEYRYVFSLNNSKGKIPQSYFRSPMNIVEAVNSEFIIDIPYYIQGGLQDLWGKNVEPFDTPYDDRWSDHNTVDMIDINNKYGFVVLYQFVNDRVSSSYEWSCFDLKNSKLNFNLNNASFMFDSHDVSNNEDYKTWFQAVNSEINVSSKQSSSWYFNGDNLGGIITSINSTLNMDDASLKVGVGNPGTITYNLISAYDSQLDVRFVQFGENMVFNRLVDINRSKGELYFHTFSQCEFNESFSFSDSDLKIQKFEIWYSEVNTRVGESRGAIINAFNTKLTTDYLYLRSNNFDEIFGFVISDENSNVTIDNVTINTCTFDVDSTDAAFYVSTNSELHLGGIDIEDVRYVENLFEAKKNSKLTLGYGGYWNNGSFYPKSISVTGTAWIWFDIQDSELDIAVDADFDHNYDDPSYFYVQLMYFIKADRSIIKAHDLNFDHLQRTQRTNGIVEIGGSNVKIHGDIRLVRNLSAYGNQQAYYMVRVRGNSELYISGSLNFISYYAATMNNLFTMEASRAYIGGFYATSTAIILQRAIYLSKQAALTVYSITSVGGATVFDIYAERLSKFQAQTSNVSSFTTSPGRTTLTAGAPVYGNGSSVIMY